MTMRNVLIAAIITSYSAIAAHAQAIELFDDADDAFLKQFNNDDGGLANTQISREQRDVYSGVASIRVTPFQRFTSRLQGWNFPIVEKPQAGQYRYLRFGW